MPLLEATGIEKRFGGVVALRAAGFACAAGEIHALLGENGAGKSTMVKVLCGVHQPDAGAVALRGEPAAFRHPAEAAAAGIIPVFQELSLVPDLSVAQNLLLGVEPRTRFGLVDGRRMVHAAETLLADLGFGGIDPRAVVRDLPLAERQIVEIAKAVGRTPKVLILDEATSSLDSESEALIQDALEGIWQRQGATSLVIAHRLSTVQNADRIFVLAAGRVVEAGTHRQLLARGGLYRTLYDLQFKEEKVA